MPPNGQPANPTRGGTAASQTLNPQTQRVAARQPAKRSTPLNQADQPPNHDPIKPEATAIHRDKKDSIGGNIKHKVLPPIEMQILATKRNKVNLLNLKTE